MSVWGKANKAKELEQHCAALGVQDMQRGREDAARHFFELAAEYRAESQEFLATGDVIEELCAARLVELRRRLSITN